MIEPIRDLEEERSGSYEQELTPDFRQMLMYIGCFLDGHVKYIQWLCHTVT